MLGLPVVDTLLWGGILVSLLTAVIGIVFSLPLGVLLALGRRSEMPVVRLACVVFIEFVRGVPFITVFSWPIICCPCLFRRLGRPIGCSGRSLASPYFRPLIWLKKCAAACSLWAGDNTKAQWRSD